MANKEYMERESVIQALNSEGITQNMRAHRKVLAVPAADVVEVRRGKWLYVSGKGRYAEYECSECKEHVCFDEKIDGTIPPYKGCPHCFAKMDGKGEGE